MTPKSFLRGMRNVTIAVAVAGSALLFGGGVAQAAPAAAAPAPLAARTLVYNASGAGQFSATADQAVGIWNQRVPNIHLQKSGSPTIYIYVTNSGGSRAYVQGLGRGTVYIDTTQVNQGHSPLRILAHELGHILGLPDNYNGNCAILMSGGSAGTSCTNPYPSSAEASRVNQLFSFAPALAGKDEAFVAPVCHVY
ncbi:snapalysin family zinc-dependent metalloprotease [Longispora sp. K20-0274]|uniref:snapalysin family zinc-dependent metalloprotease n=1 Tax=Longispora sp. K20-0274 TaxID=3088255 RepID=UPI00399B39FC